MTALCTSPLPLRLSSRPTNALPLPPSLPSTGPHTQGRGRRASSAGRALLTSAAAAGGAARPRVTSAHEGRRQAAPAPGAAADGAPAATAEAEAAAAAEDDPKTAKLKAFLEDLKTVGRVRIIVNTGMGVLESVTTLDGLFFMPFGGKGVYANVMKSDDNVDFHLLLSLITKIELVTGKSRAGDFNTHTVRFYNQGGDNGASIFVMWKPGTKGEYDPGQVEAFLKMVEKYGEEITLE